MPVDSLDFAPGDIPTAAEMDRLAEAAQPWASYTPTITNVTTSATTARWVRFGDTVLVRFQFTLSAVPSGEVSLSLPVTASGLIAGGVAAVGNIVGLRQGVRRRHGAVLLDSTSAVKFHTDADAGTWRNGSPEAWAATDTWSGHFTYEAA